MRGNCFQAVPWVIVGLGCAAFAVSAGVDATTIKNPTEAELSSLGRAIFFNKELSNPPGMSCASCHAPETGYTFPNSAANLWRGTAGGAVAGRFGDRKVPTVAYAPFFAEGPPHYDKDAIAFVGGLFWDGRANTAQQQAHFPLLNVNEMNGRGKEADPYQSLAQHLAGSSLAPQFLATFGEQIFKQSPKFVVEQMSRALVAYEKSPEVSPFTSKYDAYLEGKAKFTPQELLGMRLATGTIDGRPDGLPFRKSAHCADCHGLSNNLSTGKDIWTNSCFANLGVPRNPLNRYYTMTDRERNPLGFNSLGKRYVDLGMGPIFYGLMPDAPVFLGGMDLLGIYGTFKAPTLRNVDKRPSPGFVKAYMHNGVFKSLKEVVHFYNSRNLTTQPGEVIDFTRPNPYAGLKGKPLFAPPEYLDPWTMVNPTGVAGGVGTGGAVNNAPVLDPDAMQVGNLGLTDSQEDAIVAFLKTLTDGYFERK